MPEKNNKSPFPWRECIDWLGRFLTKKEQEFFETRPEAYERLVTALRSRRELAQAIGTVVDGIFGERKPKRAVDTACGTGIITDELAKHLAPDGQIIGVDPSQAALDYAAQTKNQRIEWRRGNFHELPLEDEETDLYTMSHAYRFTDPQRFWGEVHRVLAPNGVAIVTRAFYDMPWMKRQEAEKICSELGMETESYRLKVGSLINIGITRGIFIAKKPELTS